MVDKYMYMYVICVIHVIQYISLANVLDKSLD